MQQNRGHTLNKFRNCIRTFQSRNVLDAAPVDRDAPQLATNSIPIADESVKKASASASVRYGNSIVNCARNSPSKQMLRSAPDLARSGRRRVFQFSLESPLPLPLAQILPDSLPRQLLFAHQQRLEPATRIAHRRQPNDPLLVALADAAVDPRQTEDPIDRNGWKWIVVAGSVWHQSRQKMNEQLTQHLAPTRAQCI